MPLDTYAHYNGLSPHFGSTDELRLQLIGNQDLKARVLSDGKFLGGFLHSLDEDIEADLCEFATKAVILRVLASGDVLLVPLAPVAPLLTRFLRLASEKLESPLLPAVADCVHVLELLFARGRVALNEKTAEVLWRLNVLLWTKPLICGVAALRLVPFLLEDGPAELAGSYGPVLLLMLLNMLESRFLAVYGELFRDLPAKCSFLERVLPNAAGRLLRELFGLDILTPACVAACQIYNCLYKDSPRAVRELSPPFFALKKLFLCLVLLLRCDDSELLNIASLNMVGLYLGGMDDTLEEIVLATYERLFPRIAELLAEEKRAVPELLRDPIGVILLLCLDHPKMALHLTATNTDHRVLRDLQHLCRTLPVLRELHVLKGKLVGKLADFSELRTPEAAAQLAAIADHLLLLSVYTSQNDDFRRRVTDFDGPKSGKGPNFLCLMIFELMDSFRFLTAQLTLSHRVHEKIVAQNDPLLLEWYSRNLGVLAGLVEHPLFTNTIYLVRLLLRSVSTLRTFFVDCNSILSVFDEHLEPKDESGDLVDILASNYNRELLFRRKGSFVSSLLAVLNQLDAVGLAEQFFSPASLRKPDRKALCVKKVILLALLANFILEFSSFRYEIVNHDTFISDLAAVFKKSSSSRDVVYEQLREQLAVLQVIKNYLYNENEENRKFLWDYIPLLLVYEKTLYGIAAPPEEDAELHSLLMQHKTIAFAIMRNLTAASGFFSEAIRETYLEFVQESSRAVPKSWNDFLLQSLMRFDLFWKNGDFYDDEFFFGLLQHPEYVRMAVDINYIEDHRYTNIRTFRTMDFPCPELIRIWKRVLLAQLLEELEDKLCTSVNEKVRLALLLIELKTSICWILINLTWKDDEYGYQVPDKVNFRLLDTVLFGLESEHNVFNATNVAIEESLEDEKEEEREPQDEAVMGPEERAKLLHKYDFSGILQKITYEMTRPKMRRRLNARLQLALERFDNVSANDLYEKCKTAYFQITALAANKRQPVMEARPAKRQEVAEESESELEYDVDIDDYWVR